jgi:hypothetical protein
LETPVPILNEELEEDKPVLTEEQKILIREAYSSDVELWESL